MKFHEYPDDGTSYNIPRYRGQTGGRNFGEGDGTGYGRGRGEGPEQGLSYYAENVFQMTDFC